MTRDYEPYGVWLARRAYENAHNDLADMPAEFDKQKSKQSAVKKVFFNIPPNALKDSAFVISDCLPDARPYWIAHAVAQRMKFEKLTELCKIHGVEMPLK